MGDGSFQYITLAASLPHLGALFSNVNLPMSRYRLEERLSMLDDDDRRLLDRVTRVTSWPGVAGCESDAEVVARFEETCGLAEVFPDLVAILRERLETRMLVAALRLRRDGAEDPGAVSGWRRMAVARAIRTNWSDPTFGLGRARPWLREAQALCAGGDHIGLERAVLTEIYRQIDRAAAHHQFDFEAVTLYVLRFQLIERWQRYDAGRARDRLEALLHSTLAGAWSAGNVTPSSAGTAGSLSQ
ncbi:DUF2764 family protein [Stappia sp. ES.058]|uniref:DUF2764 family protein n=1 Tax=Stappia sp. ES.058 TaxID=1881061 RepID=UPI00087BF1C3|nr:DUF2764 family protein [Stappia sp. ES.058]SDU02789.1 Protein of unknown function [Stappia sp. ES.058]